MIKIKFQCWWTDSNAINNRIIKQFTNESDLDEYSFVTNSPDYTIILGRTDWNFIETIKDKTFYISQEPLWSPNEPKDTIHNYCSKIIIADKSQYPNRDEYIEDLLPMLYAGRGENDYRNEWDWNVDLKNKKFSKNKKISIIVKKDYYSTYYNLSRPNISEIMYEKRTKIAEHLSHNLDIDIYGNNWQNNQLNIKGEVWNKHVGLDEYHFSFCMENTIQKNYISEKFWDSVLVDTVPIYLGCSNIHDYVPKECMIYLNNLSIQEIENLSQILINDYSQEYNLRREALFVLKQKFYSDPQFNLWEKVKKLIYEN